jgi:mitotic spindle assembly checkpoint protein MAD1
VNYLEKQVKLYKAELEAVARDSRELEDRLTQGAGLVKQTMLDEAQTKADTLQAGTSTLPLTVTPN